jgi:hypothetical protein
MVPEPLVPVKAGSSPWCGRNLHTVSSLPARQIPRSPFLRLTLHTRGQSEQKAANVSIRSILSSNSPLA